MKKFNDTDFLLLNDYGRKLYHEVAAVLPIIDPHNHISPASLASDEKFENLYQLWVKNDPYKHRAMRMYGIPENLITGNEPDFSKFMAWAGCVANTIGTPLFHWSCMELKFLFGIEEVLTTENASRVWESSNEMLRLEKFSASNIVASFGVELLCTSDDLLDSLEHHLVMASRLGKFTCLPSLRSDSIISFNQDSFLTWLNKLETLTGTQILTLDAYKTAIIQRLDFFDESGCLLSDHSLDSGFRYFSVDVAAANLLFAKVLDKTGLSDLDLVGLQSHLLHFLGIEYAKRKWKMQLHIGAYRYTSSVLRNKLGPAGGYAGIGNTLDVPSLCSLLDDLDTKAALPKTILYTLNPADNAVLATLTGSFAEDGVQGKIQYGAAWWYNDHYEGIVQQLLALSSYGLLSGSIGMTTDSRSIVSFLRHDYYRRILCNLLGEWVSDGKLPADWNLLAGIVENISYNNIKNWIKK